jgi:hypothetical protein
MTFNVVMTDAPFNNNQCCQLKSGELKHETAVVQKEFAGKEGIGGVSPSI